MKVKTLLFSLILFCNTLVAWAIPTPEQPSKCPTLTLIQQMRAFANLLTDGPFDMYAGATQISLYDTNVVWDLQVYDKLMNVHSPQEAVNNAQKILDTTTGYPVPVYNTNLNAWLCIYKTNSSMFTSVVAISPVPHNLHPQ